MRELRDTELSPDARELVGTGREATLPTGADEARVLETLRARLAASPELSKQSSTSDRLSGPTRTRWKWWVAAGVGVGLTAAAAVLHFASRVPATTDPSTLDEPALQPSAMPTPKEPKQDSQPPALDVSLPAPPTAVMPVPSASAAPRRRPVEASPSQTENHLAEEVALLSKATSALHAGRAQEALGMLTEHQRRFPAGALSRQRHAARARALCQLGRMPEARSELARLDPSSPLASRTREACGFTK